MDQLFVYGKLRKLGGAPLPNNYPKARLVGGATVNGKLYDLGDYPGLLPGGSDLVIGEVYEIDAETLGALDEFESTAGYRRDQAEVSLNDSLVTCWIYCPDRQSLEGAPRIDSGDWIEYTRRRQSV